MDLLLFFRVGVVSLSFVSLLTCTVKHFSASDFPRRRGAKWKKTTLTCRDKMCKQKR